jgi:hypothetical protein
MGVITESDGAAGEYEQVEIPAVPDAGGEPAGSVLRRRSPRPSRRAVLYVDSSGGSCAPADLARWYTERGFHFYIADLSAHPIPQGRPGLTRFRRRAARRARFARLDAACAHLRETDGIDSVVISAHSADALTVALWCDARREAEPAGAVILSSPAFGGRLRRGLRIACPVLVMCPAGRKADQAGRRMAGRFRRQRGRRGAPSVLGHHVTWLSLASGLESPEQAADRRLLFDEMGRWLGAYMYGQVRDQLL